MKAETMIAILRIVCWLAIVIIPTATICWFADLYNGQAAIQSFDDHVRQLARDWLQTYSRSA